MYIWTVSIEIEWSNCKGLWEDEREYKVFAKTAEAAGEKARRINSRFSRRRN